MSVTVSQAWTGDAEVRRLRILYQLVSTLSRAAALEDIYEAAIAALLSATEADRASILMFDEDGVMRFNAWRGLSESYRIALTGQTPWSKATVDARPLTVPDVTADQEMAGYRDVFIREGIAALAFIPLALDAGVFGRLMLYYAEPHQFAPDELEAAEAIAGHVALAVERRRSESALARSEQRLHRRQGPDPRIWISAEPRGDMWVISVRDNGMVSSSSTPNAFSACSKGSTKASTTEPAWGSLSASASSSGMAGASGLRALPDGERRSFSPCPGLILNALIFEALIFNACHKNSLD